MDPHPKYLKIWLRGLKYFDEPDLDRALYTFEIIPRTPKTYFNMGMINLALKDQQAAIQCFQAAADGKNPFVSILAHFQLGVIYFSLEDYSSAHQSFSLVTLLLGERKALDFKKFGIEFCLYSSEVLFNCAICLLHLGRFTEGGDILSLTRQEEQIPGHVFDSFDIFGLNQSTKPISITEEEESSECNSPSTTSPNANVDANSSPSSSSSSSSSSISSSYSSSSPCPSSSTCRADYWTLFQLKSSALYRPILYSDLQQVKLSPAISRVEPKKSEAVASKPSSSENSLLPSPTIKFGVRKKTSNFFKRKLLL